MRKVLTQKFFARSAEAVARDLLGKFLVRNVKGKEISGMITETESYDGLDDLASHAFKGRTPRTEVMFGEAGRLYIYFVYGMHNMLNVVTGDVGHPGAVLIRSVDTVSGPGRLTKHFSLSKEQNTLMSTKENGVWFEDRGVKVDPKDIQATSRIGVDYAGPIWSQKLLRFVYKPGIGEKL